MYGKKLSVLLLVAMAVFTFTVATLLFVSLNTESIALGDWIEKKPTPEQGGYGEAVVGTGEAIYVAKCMYYSSTPRFWCYNPLTDNWDWMNTSGLPTGAFRNGACLAWDYGNYIYTLLGARYEDSDRRLFYKYDISNDIWGKLPDTPHAQGAGDALTYCGYDGKLYALLGSNEHGKAFASYNIQENYWTELPSNSNWSCTDDGASLVWAGGEYLYALRGEYDDNAPNGDFARYHIPTATWEDLTPMPEINGACDGASLLWVGYWLDEYEDCIFALGGGNYSDTDGDNHEDPSYNFYCCYISNDTWRQLENIPYPVGEYVGNRLGFANGNIYYWQGTIFTWNGGNKFCQWSLAQNISPVAVNDIATTDEDEPICINVTSNDYDTDGGIDYSTVEITQFPSHGSLQVYSNGTIKYNPVTGYYGADQFKYRVKDNDGEWSNEATVTITISPVNDAPVVNDDFYATDEDVVLTVDAPGVLANDSDADGDTLTAILESNPSHGSLTSNSDGSFVYEPEENYYGIDNFTYRAYDEQEYSTIATVYINVTAINDIPVANFSFTPSNPTNLDTIQFTDLSSDLDGFITNYTWNFGDGAISYEKNPEYRYVNDGTYNITLLIADDDGATNTTSKQLTISKIQYTLTASVEPGDAGYIELNPVGGIYAYGTVVTITAYVTEGYEFHYWSGNISGDNPTVQIIMDSNKTIIAHFTIINQPPTITIIYPSDDQEISGIITLRGRASDDVSIEKVEIKVDEGKWITASGTYYWDYQIDTTEFKNGYHIIYARACDRETYSEIASVNVTIFNNLNKPCIVISEPENGSIVKGEVAIQGKAWDIDGNETIEKVEIKIGNEWRWYEATEKNNWTYLWNTKTLESNGYYTIYARAWDGEKYSEIKGISVFVNNLIHLQINEEYKGFVTPYIPQEHWINLSKNKTYKISVDRLYFGDKADFKLEIVNLTKIPIDENAKGYGEEYTFKCNKTDDYYIKVYSDIDAPYYLKVQEIHHLTKAEILMLLGFLGIIVIIALSPAVIEKIRKAKSTPRRRIIFSVVDYFIGVPMIYVFLTKIYEMSENPSLKNAVLFALSAFIYPVYEYFRKRKT